AEFAILLARAGRDPLVLINHGTCLRSAGRPAEAEASFRRAIELDPASAAAGNGLGCVLTDLNRFSEALDVLQEASRQSPKDHEITSNLGLAYYGMGRHAEAVASYEAAIRLAPNFATPYANLILALDPQPDPGGAKGLDARRRLDENVYRHLAQSLGRLIVDTTPGRRLRVGYISPDFRRHSAGLMALPLMRAHDRGAFEVHAYDDTIVPDDLSPAFRAAADSWIGIVGLGDEAVARKIRSDGIDILVDISGYHIGRRQGVFARRAAPVQASGLGYGGGIGLSTMDAVLLDSVVAPAGAERLFIEPIERMPAYLFYDPPAYAAAVAPPPALSGGRVTFGCFNRVIKITPDAVALWARVLGRVPRSRLLIKDTAFDTVEAQDRVVALFKTRGIEADRLEIRGRTAHKDHLGAFAEVDIGLDPLPLGGGFSAAESLWMGVPFVTLIGERVAERGGASFLTAVGLTDFIAETQDDYVDIAVRAAGDLDRLARIRSGLRRLFAKSAFCDVTLFTRGVEEAYHRLWNRRSA
ncbi:MAG: tetratricopeptide repeat protein, partial [Alphaproteobacteria bacterium]|nr:tetratricopeptide repeat protein [Alphaproteobacteria bacterium]